MSTITESATDLAPFGWYPDPAGSDQMRWWNGKRWTNNLERQRPEMQPAYGYGTDGSVTQQIQY